MQSLAVSMTMAALLALTEGLPIGTNLGLLHFFWMQVSGVLLSSRGALFPALQAIGLQAPEIRRSWAAFRYGDWQIKDLLSDWQGYVLAQGQWREHRHGGYRPRAEREPHTGDSSRPDGEVDPGRGRVSGRVLGRLGTAGHQGRPRELHFQRGRSPRPAFPAAAAPGLPGSSRRQGATGALPGPLAGGASPRRRQADAGRLAPVPIFNVFSGPGALLAARGHFRLDVALLGRADTYRRLKLS